MPGRGVGPEDAGIRPARGVRMKSVRLRLLCIAAVLLSGCVYAPVLQASYPYSQHPGVVLEVWWQYDSYGTDYQVSHLVNRSNVDKCAWTDQQEGRLLRAGEVWQVGQVGQVAGPGGVGVANVTPGDPSCVNARRQYRG